MYRQAADEWPINHTPPEVKEQYQAEMKALQEQEEKFISSDDSANSDQDGQVAPDKGMLASNSLRRSSQTHGLPTPPISADSPPLNITASKCRRRASEGKNALREESPGGRNRKRRRRDRNEEDAEEADEERPTKIRFTHGARPIRQLRTRPPGRLKIDSLKP